MYDPRPVELVYPRLFPTQSHDIINGARDDALVAFWKGIEERPGAVLRLADQFIDSIVRAFGHEACRTMNEGFSRWNSSAVCSAMNEFVEVVARYAYDACEIHHVYNGYTPWRQDDFVNRTNSRMRSSDVMKEHVAERATTTLRMTLLSAESARISPDHDVEAPSNLSNAPDPIPMLKGWRGGLPISQPRQENTAPTPHATPMPGVESLKPGSNSVDEPASIIPADTIPADDSQAENTHHQNNLVRDRSRLLKNYKAATGNPNDHRIYRHTAKTINVYKPQFYDWKNGKLPDTSDITRRLEEFLKDLRPIPENRA